MHKVQGTVPVTEIYLLGTVFPRTQQTNAMACLRDQVTFLLISGHLFCHGPHLSSAIIQANHADVYKMICEDFASMCPCQSNQLIVTEAGKPDSASWTCGSSVTVKSLENLPTIKVSPQSTLVPVHPFITFIYSDFKYVFMSDCIVFIYLSRLCLFAARM